ncbi:hypothetical protein Btru_069280 [Bulinus truncatus]|nr:hypothetical protein Btru_069280 [Bulinus truncatus]
MMFLLQCKAPYLLKTKVTKCWQKMGWVEGQGLGKSSSGISEPISVDMRVNQSAGLGSSADVSLSLDSMQNLAKTKRWTKAQQRFHQPDTTAGGCVDLPVAHITHTSGKSHSPVSRDPAVSSKEGRNPVSDEIPAPLQSSQTLLKINQMSWVHGGTELIGQPEIASLKHDVAAHEEGNSVPPGSCKSQS